MSTARFEFVPLECIEASPTNPRKHFDEAQLAELAASIKQQGVAQPILVRLSKAGVAPVRLEIVAGERRWRASKLAGLESIPAIIRELDDAQALEIQVIENLQRADLHPLEEAEGYEHLIKQHNYTAEQLADKVGKSRTYVYQRLKLCALVPEARKAFYAGKLTPATALLIARIPVTALQAKAVAEIVGGEGKWSRETLTTREAQQHIHGTYMLRLKEAQFDTKDAKLLSKAGACTSCPKRTGNAPELFTDVDSADVCTDPDCFGKKRAAWSSITIAQAKAHGTIVIEGAAAKKAFPYQGATHMEGGLHLPTEKNWSDPKSRTWKQLAAVAGVKPVLVVNPHTGLAVEAIREADMKPHLKELGLVSSKGASTENASENDRVKKAKAEVAYRQQLFAAVRAAAVGKMQREDWIEVVLRLLARLDNNDFRRLLKIFEWPQELTTWDGKSKLRAKVESLTDSQLQDLMRDITLISEVYAGQNSASKPERLLSAATRYGVDAKAIRATLITKPAKAKPTKTAGAKKATVHKPAPALTTIVPVAEDVTTKSAPTSLNPVEAWPFPSSKQRTAA